MMRSMMIHDVIEVRHAGERRLWLRFRDGVAGEVDVAKLVTFDGVFEPLAEEDFFARARVDQEMFTVAWPNGADLDADVLYATVTGDESSLPKLPNR